MLVQRPLSKRACARSRLELLKTLSTTEATPIFNGSAVDAGQLVTAAIAIDDVKTAITEAQAKLKGAQP